MSKNDINRLEGNFAADSQPLGLPTLVIDRGMLVDVLSGDKANLHHITIPGNVTTIGTMALKGCIGLKSVTLPTNMVNIGPDAFSGLARLTSITLPPVSAIFEQAFSKCIGLKSITLPSSLKYIGVSAFQGCTGLKTITLPRRVKKIEERAFEDCTSLTRICLKERTFRSLLKRKSKLHYPGLTVHLTGFFTTSIKMTHFQALFGTKAVLLLKPSFKTFIAWALMCRRNKSNEQCQNNVARFRNIRRLIMSYCQPAILDDIESSIRKSPGAGL